VTQPDEEWADDRALARLYRQGSRRVGYGDSEMHQSNFATWGLGLFGASIIIMLGFVLNAVYTTNGDLHEVKGQNTMMQVEITAMQLQLTNITERVAISDASKHP
jgi:hypothetical protein